MNWPLLQNSLFVAALATLLALSFGFLAAVFLFSLYARWRNLFLAISIIALALPPFLVTNCWLHFLGQTGVWRRWLPLNIVSLGGTIWILGLLNWPISLLLVLSAWRRLEQSQLEIDPAVSGWHLIRLLLFPMARTALIQAVALTFVLALNNFAVPAILQVKVFPAEIWVRFSTAFDTVGALRLSWPLVIAPMLMLAWLARREVPWPRVQGAVPPNVFRRQLGNGWFAFAGATMLFVCALSVGLPLYQLASTRRTWTELPGALAASQSPIWNSFLFAAVSASAIVILALVYHNLSSQLNHRDAMDTARQSRNRIREAFGVRAYSAALPSASMPVATNKSGGIRAHSKRFAPSKDLRPSDQPQNSSQETSMLDYCRTENVLRESKLCVHRASVVSSSATRGTGVRRGKHLSPFNSINLVNPFNSLVWLPFLLPGVLLGIALIFLFNRPLLSVIYQSIAIIILAFTIRYFAIGWTAIRHAANSVDPNLTDAARLEGANRWQMLRHIHWPQIAPQVLAAWYIIFLLCLWDVESIILIYPPGSQTLALNIFNFLHYGHNAQVNALCLTLLAVAVTPLILWSMWRGVSSHWSVVRSHATHNTQHAMGLCLATALVLSFAGCSPPPANEAPITSQLFSRVQVIGSRGVGVGELNKPRSVAVDRNDNLYVVDMTGRVQKFSPNGEYQLLWQMPQTDLGKPKGMCRDREGNIIVVEPHYQRVNHFSPQGELLAQWGQRGTNTGQLMMPRAVAINSHNEIFVSEYGAVERVQKFRLIPHEPSTATETGHDSPSPGGEGRGEGETNQHSRIEFLSAFGRPGTGPGEFNRPEGLCVDQQDRLYVADSCNHRIQVFDRDGKFLRTYGKPGSGKGELSYPYDICVDAAGRQYVCEFGNSRIQIFDVADHPLEIIGSPGAEPGKFSNPWGVALDSVGNLYVADSQNHRVQKFVRKETVARSQESGVGSTGVAAFLSLLSPVSCLLSPAP